MFFGFYELRIIDSIRDHITIDSKGKREIGNCSACVTAFDHFRIVLSDDLRNWFTNNGIKYTLHSVKDWTIKIDPRTFEPIMPKVGIEFHDRRDVVLFKLKWQ